MKKQILGLMSVAVLMVSVIVPRSVAVPQELDDEEMDMVGGGSTTLIDPGSGTVNSTITDNSVSSIMLSDQAQQNLSSLVNIISINSTIQVMFNLNVNFNSTVGSVNQGNTGTQTGPP